MKIVILSDDYPPASYGGAGVIAEATARGLVKAGHEVWVITTVRDKSLAGTTNSDGVEIIKLIANGGERLRAYRSLYNPQTVPLVKNYFKKINPDIVHAHNIHNYLSYACLREAKLNGAKVFLTAHDLMLITYGKLFPSRDGGFTIPSLWYHLKQERLRFNPLRNLIIRYYLGFVDQILAVSQAVKDVLDQAKLGTVAVLHNGIDVSDWSVSLAALGAFKSKYNLIGKKVILFGGRVSGAKGLNSALKALALVRQKIPQAVLLVVGDSQINQEGVCATGWITREEMKLAYATAQVVLTPSLYLDPFPTVNLEAMAMAKPVVGTIFGGTREAVVDGETGLLVDPHNIGAVVNALTLLLLDEGRALNYGEAGCRRVKEFFSLQFYIEKLLALYHNPKANV